MLVKLYLALKLTVCKHFMTIRIFGNHREWNVIQDFQNLKCMSKIGLIVC